MSLATALAALMWYIRRGVGGAGADPTLADRRPMAARGGATRAAAGVSAAPIAPAPPPSGTRTPPRPPQCSAAGHGRSRSTPKPPGDAGVRDRPRRARARGGAGIARPAHAAASLDRHRRRRSRGRALRPRRAARLREQAVRDLERPTVAPFGPFVNKNHFAGYVVLAALLAVGLAAGLASEARRAPGFLGWIESSRARCVVFAWGAAVILILAVPVCLSRGGVLSLAAGLVAFAGLRLWSRLDSRLPLADSWSRAAGCCSWRRGLRAAGRVPRPRPDARGRNERAVGIVPARGVARHRAPRPLQPLGRLRLRRLPGRAAALQDRGRPASVEHAENEYLELRRKAASSPPGWSSPSLLSPSRAACAARRAPATGWAAAS